jgi:subtilisin family serine protease
MGITKIYYKIFTLTVSIIFIFASCSLKNERDGLTDDQKPRTGRLAVLVSPDFPGFPEGISAYRAIPEDSVFEDRHRAAGLDRWYYIDETGEDLYERTKTVSELKSLQGIEHIEIIPPSGTAGIQFNDTYFSNQWHLQNAGGMLNGFKKNADINVSKVWEKYTAGKKEIIVGVLDTGAQYDHPDLAGVVIPPGPDGSRSFLASTSSTPYDYTPQNHATHVAGIIAAVNNNGIGGCGIAGGSQGSGGVRILDCQGIRSSEDDTGDVVQAIIWAADHGAVILNNSWNDTYSSESLVPDQPNLFTRMAIDYFIRIAGTDGEDNQTGPMKGGIVIFSAGNNSWQRCQPAMYENVIAVGAIGPGGETASYTNYGDWVDICAPGGNASLYGANPLAQIYSTKSNGTYGPMQGSSMACAMVSGVAALIVSQYGGPGFTNENLKEMLLGGVDLETVKSHSRHIGGMLDAYEAMTWKFSSLIADDSATASATLSSVTLTWEVKPYGDISYYAYKAIIAEDELSLKDIDPFNVPDCCIYRIIRTDDLPAGTRVSTTFNGLDRNKKYYYTVIPFTKSHRYPAGNLTGSFFTGESTPPLITLSGPDNILLRHNQKTTVDAHYSDAGDDFTFTLTTGSNAAEWQDDNAGNLTLFIDASKGAPGSYVATAELGNGKVSSKINISYTILNNRPITVSAVMDDVITKCGSLEIDLGQFFLDQDDDDIRFSVTSSEGNVRVAVEGALLRISSDSPGVSVISVAASDSFSAPAEQSFRVRFTSNNLIADIYPDCIQSSLYIAGFQALSPEVTIIGPTGRTVFKKDIFTDTFFPYEINVSGLAPGRYTVFVSASGRKIKKTITKI